VYCIGDFYTTDILRGTGVDCSEAEAVLTSRLQQIAETTCGELCRFSVTITTSCHQISTGEYRVKGYASYKCGEIVCDESTN